MNNETLQITPITEVATVVADYWTQRIAEYPIPTQDSAPKIQSDVVDSEKLAQLNFLIQTEIETEYQRVLRLNDGEFPQDKLIVLMSWLYPGEYLCRAIDAAGFQIHDPKKDFFLRVPPLTVTEFSPTFGKVTVYKPMTPMGLKESTKVLYGADDL